MVHAAVQSSLRSKVDLHGRALTRKTSFASRSNRRQNAVKHSPTWNGAAAHHCNDAPVGLRRTVLATRARRHMPLFRSLGTISSSRCQTTRSKHPLRGEAGRLCEFVFLYGRAVEPRSAGSAAWWSQTGSNRRPPACKAGALPTELWPRAGDGRNQESGNGGPGKI